MIWKSMTASIKMWRQYMAIHVTVIHDLGNLTRINCQPRQFLLIFKLFLLTCPAFIINPCILLIVAWTIEYIAASSHWVGGRVIGWIRQDGHSQVFNFYQYWDSLCNTVIHRFSTQTFNTKTHYITLCNTAVLASVTLWFTNLYCCWFYTL